MKRAHKRPHDPAIHACDQFTWPWDEQQGPEKDPKAAAAVPCDRCGQRRDAHEDI